MSQYIEFFINPGISDSFYFVDSFSRSSSVYQYAVNNVPYGKIVLLNSVVDVILENISESINSCKKQVEKQKEMIEIVSKFSNVEIEDRIQSIEEYNSVISEIEQEIEELECAKTFYQTLSSFDENLHVYVGIEVGETTKEDIVS